MFNVFDPKSVVRGSVPAQKLPRRLELQLLANLMNYRKNPQLPRDSRKACRDAYYKLEKEIADTTLQKWDVYECLLTARSIRTLHAVGEVGFRREVLVTPPIIEIDPELREVMTETGEIFEFGVHMQGNLNCDTKFAWWRDKNGATDAVCVTLEIRDLLPKPERRPVPALTPAQEALHSGITPEAFSLEKAVQMYSEDERSRIEARDNVSDEALDKRIKDAPDMGGSTLAELSEFVRNREKK